MTAKVVLIAGLAWPLVLSAQPAPSPRYVGSAACQQCHAEIYARWKKTRMANVVRDPKEHPDAIAPDLTKPNPLVTFTKDDIAFVYGSKWKQRYFKKVGDDFKQQNKNVDIKVTAYQDETQLQFLTTAFQTGTDLGIFAPPSAFVAAWGRRPA